MAKGRNLLGAAGIGLAKITDEPDITDKADILDKMDASDATDLRATAEEAIAPAIEPRPPVIAPTLNAPTIAGTFPLRDKPKKAHSRNASPRIMAGEVKSKSVYVTPEDVDIATDAEAFLKKARVLRGQIGFTMAVRIGLRLLKKKIREDHHAVLELAREISDK